MKVHPRIRGEYYRYKKETIIKLGSPPHPRGICRTYASAFPCVGFTPASAGNMLVRDSMIGLMRVHPRIRGEYYPTQRIVVVSLGSPPLPRGISDNWALNEEMVEVHPRFRGEYCWLLQFGWSAPGSPPLPRGILSMVTPIYM